MIDFLHYPPLGSEPLGKFIDTRRERDALPDDPAWRFEHRVFQMMQSSGQARTWCRARVKEQFPDEFAARAAAR